MQAMHDHRRGAEPAGSRAAVRPGARRRPATRWLPGLLPLALCAAAALLAPAAAGGDGLRPRVDGGEATAQRSRSEAAIRAALDWLVRHQDADGRWSPVRFDLHCKTPCSGPDRRSPSGRGPGWGDPCFDIGASSLAVLAFLGDGHTPAHSAQPAFRDAVRRGVRFLLAQQNAEGAIGADRDAHGRDAIVVNHALATLALLEAHVLTGDARLKKPAARAVVWLAAQWDLDRELAGVPRCEAEGGHMAAGDDRRSPAVPGWAAMAIAQAGVSGVIAKETSARVLARLEAIGRRRAASAPVGLGAFVRTRDGRRLAAPDNAPRFQDRPLATAVSMLCRRFAGQPLSDPRVREGVRTLLQQPPVWEPERQIDNGTDFTYALLGTHALFVATPAHSRARARWAAALRAAVLEHPRAGGDENGSWDPLDRWGYVGGRVYATAINALALEQLLRFERAPRAGRNDEGSK